MKIFFCSLGSWLTNRQVARCSITLICLLAGTYFVGHHFGLLAIVVLGLAVILIGGAVGAFLNWSRVEGTHIALRMKNAPQVMSGWDYRPRDVIRREAAFECGGPVTPTAVSSISSTLNENDNVWFNFTKPEPTVEEATTKAPLSSDACAVSRYDQSLIDNNGVAGE